MSFYPTQIEWIKSLQKIKAEDVDTFFRSLNFFDSSAFYLILIPLIWVGFHWRWGVRLFYLLSASSFVNDLLKNIFEQVRPGVIDPSVAMINLPTFSTPSGAAQTVIILSVILIKNWKSPFAWIIGGLYVFFVSLSRVYLGVHYPSDIIAGWIVGFILVFLFLKTYKPTEKFLSKRSSFTLLIVSQVLAFYVFLFKMNYNFSMAFTLSGIGLGLYFCRKYDQFLGYPKYFLIGLVRAIVGVAGVFALSALFTSWFKNIELDKNISAILVIYSITLWVSLFSPMLLKRIFPERLSKKIH